MLKTIKILRDRVENWDAYPFSVSAIRSLDELNLRSRVCLFADKLEAHDFTLVGRDDKPYGRLYIKDNQPVLELYDRKGGVIWSAPPHGGFTPVNSR